MDSSSSSRSSLQLAMAAFVGASLMAISAFYIHKRSVDQILQRLIQIRKSRLNARKRLPVLYDQEEDVEEDEDEDEEEEHVGSDPEIDRSLWKLRYSRSLNDREPYRYRISSSLPNVVLGNHWVDEEMKLDDDRTHFFRPSSSFNNLDFIPPGFTRPQTTQRNGSNQSHMHSGSRTRLASIDRPSTPRSLVFESVDDSDEEGILFPNEEENTSNYDHGNSALIGCSSMQMQDADYNIQDPTFVMYQASSVNSAQDKIYGEVEIGSHDGANLLDNEKVEKVTMHSVRKDPTDIVIALKTVPNEAASGEEEEACMMLRECLALRKKYVYRENVAPWMKETITKPTVQTLSYDPFHFDSVKPTGHCLKMEDGVVHVYANKDATEDLYPVASSTTFFTDMDRILRIISLGIARSLCHHRLRLLEEKFRLHLSGQADREFLAQKDAPHRDFYNVRKVDTHVHHSTCMNQKHLLRFIKSKLRKKSDEVVIFRDGKYLTLKEVFESLDLTGYDLNVDLLDVHAEKNTFRRFNKFNLKYNPCGQSRLREIFLKQDNLIQGRFLAELTKQVLSDLEASKYQMAEYRVSIYGRKQSEWDQLASWFINNTIYSENAVWLIQLPRLYNVYRKMGTVTSFQDILDNVFIPLFEVTIDPGSHPQLHVFLMQVVGFDIVDDESKHERRPTKHMPKPSEWTNEFNPAYSYYAYYCYANLFVLNKLRESKGMPTIKFRPHCGEVGDIDHLAAAFLLCHGIAHGNNLKKSPVLQYLYYLAQIGLAMSPLSYNSLFKDYHWNPFPVFFQRGLNVSLSTDDPLHIHLTKEPLVEEYSIAAQVWKLTPSDLCEIARNSVYQSGFTHGSKLHWLGDKYFKRGPEGNDIHKTNVPNLRIIFRHKTWKEEMQYVYMGKYMFPQEIDP